MSQIGATFLLLHLFAFRNFAVGTAYSRTEPAQAALFGLLFLGETVGPMTLIAIAISVAGVMLISVARCVSVPAALVTSVFSRTAGIGLLSGTLFGIAAVVLSRRLAGARPSEFPDAGGNHAVCAIVAADGRHARVDGVARPRGHRPGSARRGGSSPLVGFVGATASFGWFVAMTLQQAAIVKALAQIEMIFTLPRRSFFPRAHQRLEIAGCFLIVAGIIVLVLG